MKLVMYMRGDKYVVNTDSEATAIRMVNLAHPETVSFDVLDVVEVEHILDNLELKANESGC